MARVRNNQGHRNKILNILYNPIDFNCQGYRLIFMRINKKRNTITITGLDLLKAMKNAKTPLNPFLIKKGHNGKSKKQPRA